MDAGLAIEPRTARRMTAGEWAAGGVALVVGAAFAFVLAADIGYEIGIDWRLRYQEWVVGVADAVNQALGGEFKRSGFVFVGTVEGKPVTLASETLIGWVGTIPTLAAGVAVATLFAVRVRRLGWKVGVPLALFGVLLVVGVWPVLSGVLQGLGLGLAGGLSMGYMWDVQRWTRDVAPVLVCVMVAGTWWTAAKIRGESGATERMPGARPEHAWWAAGVSSVVAVIACLSAVAGMEGAVTMGLDGEWLNAGRVVIRAGLAVVTAGMAMVALVCGRGSRYGWVPAAMMLPVGGEAAGGLVLLLMIVLRMDAGPAGGPAREITDAVEA